MPDSATIESMIDAAFWASLRREEGYVPKISLAFLPPDNDTYPLRFEYPLPLSPSVLAKVAPVVERPGIHLGVWPRGDALEIWGTTRTTPTFSFVLEVVEPGLLVIKHARGERAAKYVNVAVLEGDMYKIVDEAARSAPGCPMLLSSLLGVDSPTGSGSVNVLIQLAVSMRAHHRGGSLLIVPSGSASWMESIVQPISYAVAPPYRGLSALLGHTDENDLPWQEALRDTVDAVAGLTAADGATIITDTYDLLAFGAKITRRRDSSGVEQVTMTEPVEGATPAIVTAPQLGGTRHLSAAQFVHDQQDSIALVASQDRRFTVFVWSSCDDAVRAHRVEALLL